MTHSSNKPSRNSEYSSRGCF